MVIGKGYRTEKDILGSVKVPFSAYYGIQTVRASKNFPISSLRINPTLNKALAHVKIAAALVNAEAKKLDTKIAQAIVKAGKDVISGKYDDQFIVDVYQAGAGTPWHMNMNEVLANVALEKLRKKKGNYKVIDPHNHVNMGQSTNDVIPTSLRIASLQLTNQLLPEISKLVASLKKKGKQFKFLTKSGRTHLQDAVPITLGREFTAWAHAIEKTIKSIKDATKNLQQLGIGGTAIGTGLNSFPSFGTKAVKHLKKQTKLQLSVANDKIETTQFMGDFLNLSGALRTLAVELTKVSNDIRLLNSGPQTGLNEITLPQVEPGSSIMPNKFNPSMAEMMNMVCYQVMGNDETIKEAAVSGQLELNVMTPVLAHNLLQSLEILRTGIKEFNDKCIKGVVANKKILKHYCEVTPSYGTVLNSIVGYDEAAKLIRKSLKENKSIKQIAIEESIITKREAERLFKC